MHGEDSGGILWWAQSIAGERVAARQLDYAAGCSKTGVVAGQFKTVDLNQVAHHRKLLAPALRLSV